MVMPKTIKRHGLGPPGIAGGPHGHEHGGHGQAQGAGQAIEFGLHAALPEAHVHPAQREHGEDHQQDRAAPAEAVQERPLLREMPRIPPRAT